MPPTTKHSCRPPTTRLPVSSKQRRNHAPGAKIQVPVTGSYNSTALGGWASPPDPTTSTLAIGQPAGPDGLALGAFHSSRSRSRTPFRGHRAEPSPPTSVRGRRRRPTTRTLPSDSSAAVVEDNAVWSSSRSRVQVPAVGVVELGAAAIASRHQNLAVAEQLAVPATAFDHGPSGESRSRLLGRRPLRPRIASIFVSVVDIPPRAPCRPAATWPGSRSPSEA